MKHNFHLVNIFHLLNNNEDHLHNKPHLQLDNMTINHYLFDNTFLFQYMLPNQLFYFIGFYLINSFTLVGHPSQLTPTKINNDKKSNDNIKYIHSNVIKAQ